MGGYGQDDFARYFFAITLVGQLTVAWDAWYIDRWIRHGELNYRLTRPVAPVHEAIADNLAYKARTATIILIAWAVTAVFWPAVRLPLHPTRLALAVVAVVLAAGIRFFNGYATGLLAFWTTRATAFVELQFGILVVPVRPHRASDAASCRCPTGSECVVVSVDARLPCRPAHGCGQRAERHHPRLRHANTVARGLVARVPGHLVARTAALRCCRRMTAATRIDGAQAPPSPHRRVLRLLAACWRINLAEELQYRGNFIASLLGTTFWMATALLTVALFFSQTTQLGGWGLWDVVVLLGVFNALTGVIETVLRPGIGQLADDVRSGALDLVLVRPVDAQLYTLVRRLDIWRITDVVLGFALAGYALVRIGRPVAVVTIVSFALTLAAAVAVVYAIWVALMSLAFWFVAVENLSVLFDGVYEAARYPVSAYPGALRFLFVYLIPVAWTTTIPASALTGRIGIGTAVVATGVGALALGLTRLLWRAAIRRYTSAGG